MTPDRSPLASDGGALSSAARDPAALPAWYPDWARRLAELYFSGTTCVFVLHGNVHDLVRQPGPGGADAYANLVEFLGTQVFGSWDIVLHHDLARGLRPLAGSDPERLRGMVERLASHLGDPGTWRREPDRVLAMLERLVDRNLLRAGGSDRGGAGGGRAAGIACIFEYAQYLVPRGEHGSLARGEAARIVQFLHWAENPYVKRLNFALCLIVEKLTELSARLVANPYVATIDVPMPGEDERERFVAWASNRSSSGSRGAPDSRVLARASSGLSLASLDILVSQTRHAGGDVRGERFREMKKGLIERECGGLVEFVEPSHTLDMVVGHEAAKERLREDAEFIARGELHAAPMGYLICGPVGTGKTFLAECYAGSIGIPCLELRNFRSKYVGETEGNLEQVLTVLRSLGPVVVIVDEADAALGNRQAEGDSGTSSRVFSMIANQMGDTRYRGKIIWMLLTSRPDLLPIDLKRQGRAEVHIPLFYPESAEEVRGLFLAMARKNRAALEEESLPAVEAGGYLSGADIEGIVIAAKRLALRDGRSRIEKPDLEAAVADFIPSAQGLEKELQEAAAALECTQRSFLSGKWADRLREPGGRARLEERLAALRRLVEE